MTKEIMNSYDDILCSVKEALEYIARQPRWDFPAKEELLGGISEAVRRINAELFGSEKVKFCDLCLLFGGKDGVDKDRFMKECSLWADVTGKALRNRYRAGNVWDEKFLWLMDYARYVDKEIIVENARKSLLRLDEEQQKQLNLYYQSLKEMWGNLDTGKGIYEVASNRAEMLAEHREDFIWLYGKLEDYRSKLVLCAMLYNWITFDPDYLQVMEEGNFTDYFDLDIVRCSENEVVCDLGAYTGDSALNFIQTYGKYKKIYCYEITENILETAKKNLRGFHDIEFRNKGVGAQNGRMYVKEGRVDATRNTVENYDTGKEIEVVSLDNDVADKVSLIKMDIEGAEQQALLGCRRHIKEEHPKLLISVYHNNEDIWKIPRMIDNMDKDYHFYLRSNGKQWGPAEIVLFAV